MTRLNIAIEPPAVAQAALIALASDIDGDGLDFRITNDRRIPHLTVYMSEFSISVKTGVFEDLLERIVASTPRFPCQDAGLSLTANGYVEVAYEKSAVMCDLQAKIVAGSEATQTRIVPSAAPDPHLNIGERANLERAGYEFLADQFRPHVTVARFLPTVRVTLPAFERQLYSFAPMSLTLFVADSAGCAVERLASARFPWGVTDPLSDG